MGNRYIAGLLCLLVGAVFASSVMAGETKIAIRYQQIAYNGEAFSPMPFPGVVPSGTVFELKAPLTFDFYEFGPKWMCEFRWWTVGGLVTTERIFDYTVPDVGFVQAVAWYSCNMPCKDPKGCECKEEFCPNWLIVAGINSITGLYLDKHISVIEATNPVSAAAPYQFYHNPYAMIMDQPGEELLSVTAKERIEGTTTLGDVELKVEYVFDEWMLYDNQIPEGQMQGVGIRTIEFSPADRERGVAAYAFYKSRIVWRGVDDWRDAMDKQKELEDYLRGIKLGRKVHIPRFCLAVFGAQDCPQCTAGPMMCGYDFRFRNVPHHDIYIVDADTTRLVVARQMANGDRIATVKSELIRKVGGLENLSLLFVPRPGRRAPLESLMSINYKERGRD